MIIYYTSKPQCDLPQIQQEEKLKSYEIKDHLPNEHIIQANAAGSSSPIIRLLFNSGRVWRSASPSDDNDVADDDGDDGDGALKVKEELSGGFIKQFGIDTGLVVVSVDCFTYVCVYLVKDLHRGGKTSLYGEGKNHYDSLGNDDGEGIRQIFVPNQSEEITHIACCFSFTCCVINKRDIRISGQDWISIGTALKWGNSLFIADEDIVDIKGGNFHLVAYLKDHRFLVAGDLSSGQTMSGCDANSVFTYVTLDYPIRTFFCASNRTLVAAQNGTFKMYGDRSPTSNNIQLAISFDGSTEVEGALLFKEPLILVPKNHPNILLFELASRNAKYDITEYLPHQTYQSIGVLGHNQFLLIYPKGYQLTRYFNNLLKICISGKFSDITII